MLVDTNVLSQLTRPHGDQQVIRWIDFNFKALLVPAPVISELVFGAHRHTDPVQRDRLIAVTYALLKRCSGRTVAFDATDGELHGRLSGVGVRTGRTLPPGDSMVAEMALNRGLPVATRNGRHFEPVGVTVIDPWTA